MADVRALLRSERAVRRVSHPEAQYSSSGALSCRVCFLPLKAESLWELHIKSKQHRINAQKRVEYQANDAGAVRDVDVSAGTTRKRKASFEGHEERDLPKAQKLAQLPNRTSGHARVESEVEPKNTVDDIEPNHQAEERSQLNSDITTSTSRHSKSQSNEATINEDEWEAFEREVARLPLEQTTVKAVNSTAIIEAKPLSAEEIAAHAREEQSRQREMKEAEIEEEKEEAARKLENELDEMEELELRVRRLREKREAIRQAKCISPTLPGESTILQQQIDKDELKDEVETKPTENPISVEISSDDSDEGEWDAWRLI